MRTLFTHQPFIFIRHYKLFSLAVGAALVALILQLCQLQTGSHWLLAITTLLATLPLLKAMWDDLQRGTYGIDVLAITAIVASVVLKEYWAAMVIVLMLTGGEALEDYAEHRAKSELDALLTRAPQRAHVIRGRKTVDVAVAEVSIGDRLIIKPGEVVPVDAIILEGSANFDESSLTGESIPETKTVADQLLSGSINLDGAITAKALHAASDSQYQQIVKLVRGASQNPAPFVRLADRYSIPFTAVAFAIAGVVWFISGDAIRFLEVIVVATPCPLLLAAPIAIISGMSRAAKQGIIIRTGSALERLAQVKTIAFDKTGTLTEGKPTVADITAFGSFTKAEVLGFAAALETASAHVLATAIQAAAATHHVKALKAKHVTESSGHGLSAMVGGKQVLVGRLSLLEEKHVTFPASFKATQVKQTVTFVAVQGQLAGMLTFKDEVRPESKQTLVQLRKLGIAHFLMVTGDNHTTAKAVAKTLGISDIRAEALPADKLHIIEGLTHRPVVFVGDGVNDAPVLTVADVGIALGARGSTAASESADIVIMPDNIGHVAQSVDIARRTFRIAKQSILVGIGLSVVLMLIFATGRFQPIQGALIQEVVDVVVIFNALRAHTAGRRRGTPTSS